jgi:hypothetical protein
MAYPEGRHNTPIVRIRAKVVRQNGVMHRANNSLKSNTVIAAKQSIESGKAIVPRRYSCRGDVSTWVNIIPLDPDRFSILKLNIIKIVNLYQKGLMADR